MAPKNPKTPEELKLRLEQIRLELEGLSEKEVPTEAALLHQAGEISFKLGDYETAKLSLERAIELDRRVYGNDHPEIARGLNDLALVLRAMGFGVDATRSLQESVRLYQKINGPGHPTVARCLHNLGRAYLSTNDTGNAKESLEKALWIKQQALGAEHPSVRPTAQVLGLAKAKLKDPNGAKDAFKMAFAVSAKTLGETHPDTLWDRQLVGRMEELTGNLTAAQNHVEAVIKSLQSQKGQSHQVAMALNTLGRLQGKSGDKASADTLKKAIAMSPGGARDLSPTYNYGVALYKQGKKQEAVAQMEKACLMAGKYLGDQHPRTVFYQKNLKLARRLSGQ